MGLSAPQHALELGFRILIWIMYLWIETWTPFIRHIDEEELTLYRYPSVHSYVNKIYLHLIICCTPTIIFLFYYLIKRDENTIPDIINQFYGITLAYCLNALYTTTIKTTLGRPRPNFFLRCFPDGYGTNIEGCTGEYDGQMDGRKSFPSGHTSFCFTGMVYLTLFLFDRIDFKKQFTGRGIVFTLCMMPILFATLVGVSRTCDYHHHYSDVVGGAILGTAVGTLVYYYHGNLVDESVK